MDLGNTTAWLRAAALATGIFAVILTASLLSINDSVLKPTNANKPAVEPVPVRVESLVLFTGNTFWSRHIEAAARRTDDPAAFPFARLTEFDRDKYQAWVTGLECPITEKGVGLSSTEMNELLIFNCNPEFVDEFSKWFDVVSLANNHTDNMGPEGFIETQRRLQAAGIQHFGHYNPEQHDELCEVIALPVKVTYSDDHVTEAKLPIAMCGHHGVFRIPSKKSIGMIAQYASRMPVIAMPHSGAEYKPAADRIKTRSYRAMIDAGADMVLGDHPHWVQNTEAYQNKLIVYSMGNFLFDQRGSLEVIRSAAVEVKFKINEFDPAMLDQWLTLGETCSKYHDTCLDETKRQGLSKLNIAYDFTIVATNNRGFQTHPDPSLTKGIKQRMNWDVTVHALKQNS